MPQSPMLRSRAIERMRCAHQAARGGCQNIGRVARAANWPRIRARPARGDLVGPDGCFGRQPTPQTTPSRTRTQDWRIMGTRQSPIRGARLADGGISVTDTKKRPDEPLPCLSAMLLVQWRHGSRHRARDERFVTARSRRACGSVMAGSRVHSTSWTVWRSALIATTRRPHRWDAERAARARRALRSWCVTVWWA
jgi:hypothetical protein